jgi:hypothetical protein
MNQNEPAYPVVAPNGQSTGLTKRELIAAMAMQGLVSNHEAETLSGVTAGDAAVYLGMLPKEYNPVRDYPMVVAKSAVAYADALLAELAKEQQ